MRWSVLVLLAACPRHATIDEPPIARPSEGISIAIYQPPGKPPFALVDDRGYLDVTNGTVMLDRIDPAATLPSIVIEPLDGAPLTVGACTREQLGAAAPAPATGTDANAVCARVDKIAVEVRAKTRPARDLELARAECVIAKRIAETDGGNPAPPPPPPATPMLSPIIRCAVTAAPGKHFVRILHIAPTIAFRGGHGVKLDGERATITSRYQVTLPNWKRRGEVALYDGIPGTGDPPLLIARGAVVLDGMVAIMTSPTRTVPARIRRVYDGAVRERDQLPIDPGWGRESRRGVFVVLELDDAKLPVGTLDVHAGLPDEPVRDVVVGALDRELIGTTLRVPLWVDDELHGVRRNDVDTFPGPAGRVIQQRLQLSVASTSETAREVWIEERMRPTLKRDVRGTPTKPAIDGDVARVKLTIPPHGTERVSFTIRYDL